MYREYGLSRSVFCYPGLCVLCLACMSSYLAPNQISGPTRLAISSITSNPRPCPSQQSEFAAQSHVSVGDQYHLPSCLLSLPPLLARPVQITRRPSRAPRSCTPRRELAQLGNLTAGCQCQAAREGQGREGASQCYAVRRAAVIPACTYPVLVSCAAANGGIDAQERRGIAVFRGSKYWLLVSLLRFEDSIDEGEISGRICFGREGEGEEWALRNRIRVIGS